MEELRRQVDQVDHQLTCGPLSSFTHRSTLATYLDRARGVINLHPVPPTVDGG